MSPATQVDPATIDGIIQRWESKPSFLIEILQDVQDEYKYLPREALRQVSMTLNVPMSKIFHIATFYKAFSLEPKGDNLVSVCLGTACHVKGGQRILDAFCRELGIQAGETTKDLKFTLERVNCVGACAMGPVIKIDDDYHGQVKTARLGRILKSYE